MCVHYFFFLMFRRPSRSTRTDTRFPYPTLFRSVAVIGVLFKRAAIPVSVPERAAMRIAIASDHGAFALKELLVPWLRENHDVVDLGTHGPASVDYPDYGYRLAAAIAAGEAEYGVALCGSDRKSVV